MSQDRLFPVEGGPVSVEEARVWLARCRASLNGAPLSSKLVSSRREEDDDE
jgi:hypothetical protein